MHPNISYWLAATYFSDIGPITVRRWLSSFSNIQALFSASTSTLQQAGLTSREMKCIKNPDWKCVEKTIHWSEKTGTHLLCVDDEKYPKLLREIADPPLVLYVQGDVSLLSQPQIALVGSRNPTGPGSDTAQQFSYALASSGFIVTSGMALGIDAASHRGALLAGGKTIAVMGTGLAQIYPNEHRSLSEEIIKNGALVSTLPPDTPPKAKHFPARNRIISGLSLGVVVVEAALRSGSLITARFAVEQGREVFAIPGSIHNPMARGCHFLIHQGAKLVETAEDIVEELRSLIGLFPQTSTSVSKKIVSSSLNSEQKKLLDTIDYAPTAFDIIMIRSGLTSNVVSSMLLDLELEGCIQSVSGGYTRCS